MAMVSLRAARCTSMKPPPPILPASGWVTASAKATATAASTALPPAFKMSTPIMAASRSGPATMPWRATVGLAANSGCIACAWARLANRRSATKANTASRPTLRFMSIARYRACAASAVHRIILAIRFFCGRAGDAVRHGEEARDRRDVPDVALGEACRAQGLAIVLLDQPGRLGELPAEIEHGARAPVEFRRAIVGDQRFGQHRIARQPPHGGAVRDQAIVTVISAGHDHGDYFPLELRESRGREHQVVGHGDERLELGEIEGIGVQHVGHEPELLLALGEIGLHRLVERPGRELQRHYSPLRRLVLGHDLRSGFSAPSG